MKTEVWRVSGKSPPRRFPIVNITNRCPYSLHYTDGTLRWQAPELMAGGNDKFLAAMDVYAFAMCCVEILNKGNLPWPLLDDDAVRSIVLSAFNFTSIRVLRVPDFLFPTGDHGRPEIPGDHLSWKSDIAQIITLCWSQQPASRPKFPKVVDALEIIGRKHGVPIQHVSPDVETTPRIPLVPMSPDMHPLPELPALPNRECMPCFV